MLYFYGNMKDKTLVAGLTKFDIGLWAFSVITVTLSFVLAPVKDYLTLTTSLIGVTCLIFVAKGNVMGQVLSLATSIFYAIVSYKFAYYGEMIICLGLTVPISVFSIISWLTHPHKKLEVKVGKLNRKKVIIMIVAAIGVTVGFYFILRALNTANLIFSTISIATSFSASYLVVMRSPYYALAYTANDIVLIIMWSLAAAESISYLPMVICFSIFIINDLYGFISWRKMKKRQAEESIQNETEKVILP